MNYPHFAAGFPKKGQAKLSSSTPASDIAKQTDTPKTQQTDHHQGMQGLCCSLELAFLVGNNPATSLRGTYTIPFPHLVHSGSICIPDMAPPSFGTAGLTVRGLLSLSSFSPAKSLRQTQTENLSSGSFFFLNFH